MQVSVYLDGYRYHASTEHNNIAADARKRMRLRADEEFVFQLTWHDVMGWAGQADQKGSDWEPYRGIARSKAVQAHQQAGRRGEELNDLIFTNPVMTLLEFLADPDLTKWRVCAESVLTGLLAHEQHARQLTATNSASLPERLRAALNGERLPSPVEGKISLVSHMDVSFCRVVLAVDQRDNSRVFSGFTVLDDFDRTIKADEEAHRGRWNAWLRWGDLLQFLPSGGGDGLQLALSDIDVVDPLTLAIGGGTGAYIAVRQEMGKDEPSVPGSHLDSYWRRVADDVDTEIPGLLSLVHALADRGVPVPEVGFELGDQAWVAELAWPEQRVAVVVDLSSIDHTRTEEQRRRDAAFAADGWQVRKVSDWSVDSLSERLAEEEDK
jgi:hypothetical protein